MTSFGRGAIPRQETSQPAADGIADAALPTLVAYDVEGRREHPPGIPLAATVLTVGSWPLARALAQAVDCVVITRRATCWSEIAGLAADLRTASSTPLVIRAHRLRPAERSAIARIARTTLVAGRSPAESMWAAVQSAATTHVLDAIFDGLADAHQLPEVLRRAAVILCTADPPPPSVVALCARAGVHRRTLWYHWCARARGRDVRLEDAVMSVVLLRASVRWAAGQSWREAAQKLGVDRKTLARAARRAGAPEGLPPHRGVSIDAVHAAVRRFVVAKLARPLLRGQSRLDLTP